MQVNDQKAQTKLSIAENTDYIVADVAQIASYVCACLHMPLHVQLPALFTCPVLNPHSVMIHLIYAIKAQSAEEPKPSHHLVVVILNLPIKI